ncbi:dephospho-CoA kinase [Jiulongibacter sp. NS-SX5]|uniref:dephospho-CoA kinase n=1 Tax=Jiulongibacter sp. NS-SX5 TaxID=3463854 RepID=UPI0040598BBF
MLKVGITGGIGSGKSTVAQVFETIGIPVYYADLEAKNLINNSEEIRIQIKQLLGEGAYSQEGYNKRYVAQKVFKNKELLLQLNEIVHPAVRAHFNSWASSQQNTPYVLKEAAVVENKEGIDYLIYVHASKETRLNRTLSRDIQRSKDEVMGIIEKQKSPEEFRALADFEIKNEDQLLIEQVLQIHKKLIFS